MPFALFAFQDVPRRGIELLLLSEQKQLDTLTTRQPLNTLYDQSCSRIHVCLLNCRYVTDFDYLERKFPTIDLTQLKVSLFYVTEVRRMTSKVFERVNG